MKSGTREEFRRHLEKQFPTEKEAIAALMELITVSLSLYLICSFSNVNKLMPHKHGGLFVMFVGHTH